MQTSNRLRPMLFCVGRFFAQPRIDRGVFFFCHRLL
uniref:Uncharacterized protein n=1 Tax=Siphoviridae sp. ct6h44 TaxID=2827784 RepID=A0A8S5SYI5_9CAUD|nr:MAG TPA: hypothetical protein [Siphoviridae sp. ct6h44]